MILVNEEVDMVRRSYKRCQRGFFHVWVRGSNRYNVFYSDNDFIEFLKCCQSSALKHKTVITAILLMDNHVHMQLYTNCLNKFMNSLLISFCQRYNRGWSLRGHVFESPFSSSPIYSLDVLEGNMLYILNNPVMAGMCQSVRDYKWSSFHFMSSPVRNPMANYIFVDKSFMKFFFHDKRSLIRQSEEFVSTEYRTRFRGLIFPKDAMGTNGVNSAEDGKVISLDDYGVCEDKVANVGYVFDWSVTDLKTRKGLVNKRFLRLQSGRQNNLFAVGDDKEDNCFGGVVCLDGSEGFVGDNNCGEDCEKHDNRSKKTVRVTDNEIAMFYKRLLRNRSQRELSKKEFTRIVRILRFSGKATCRQIASVTHESYNYIIRLF